MVAFSAFLGVYLFSMLSAMALLIGVGLGVLIAKPINEVFKGLQKNIYLSEKQNMIHEKRELEAKLEKLKNEGVA
jgi:hypothetical protein